MHNHKSKASSRTGDFFTQHDFLGTIVFCVTYTHSLDTADDDNDDGLLITLS